jgi:hypothetical protein
MNASSRLVSDLSQKQGLRLLQSLRYGLPPDDAVEYLTVGYLNTLPVIERALNSNMSDGGRWMMVKGDYGEGKSHFLRVFRNLAHSLGYASCYLCADAGASALNHPQRFLSTMLSTLELPNTSVQGYYGLLMELLLDSNTLQWVHESCSDPEVSSRTPFFQIADALRALMKPEQHGIDANDDLAASLRHQAANHLLGATIKSRAAAPYIREAAYRLLKNAGQLVRRLGCRGLVILLDETESIFTKLPNEQSRTGALKVLSALCEGSPLDSCYVVMAITPDAYTHLASKAHREIPQWTRLPRFEPTDKFSNRLLKGATVLECPKVSHRDTELLLERVKEIYGHVHNVGVNNNGTLWSTFVSKLSSRNIPTRLLLRQTVDFLDARRLTSLPHGTAV